MESVFQSFFFFFTEVAGCGPFSTSSFWFSSIFSRLFTSTLKKKNKNKDQQQSEKNVGNFQTGQTSVSRPRTLQELFLNPPPSDPDQRLELFTGQEDPKDDVHGGVHGELIKLELRPGGQTGICSKGD